MVYFILAIIVLCYVGFCLGGYVMTHDSMNHNEFILDALGKEYGFTIPKTLDKIIEIVLFLLGPVTIALFIIFVLFCGIFIELPKSIKNLINLIRYDKSKNGRVHC